MMDNKYIQALIDPMWGKNPISVQMLGICSSLAVTVQMKTAIVMGLSLTFVVAISNLLISVLRKWIPKNIRIIAELCIMASLVIVADEFLKAFFYGISKQLSVFVGLIITNCILMGRAETFALGNPPLLSFIDGIGNGLGYTLVLTVVSFIRELFGSGTLLGFQVIPDIAYSAGYQNMGFMQLAPAAFIIIGLWVWLQKTWLRPSR
ncbi:MAG: NADH:ubiquinone reductase (Na(+)-transporting) subunit D [Desulfobacterales bacterium]|nr:NADH:ubiquinone reductase (Na(+)-transporting) subunit D [Desulfobacterales bacterium]